MRVAGSSTTGCIEQEIMVKSTRRPLPLEYDVAVVGWRTVPLTPIWLLIGSMAVERRGWRCGMTRAEVDGATNELADM